MNLARQGVSDNLRRKRREIANFVAPIISAQIGKAIMPAQLLGEEAVADDLKTRHAEAEADAAKLLKRMKKARKGETNA